MTDRVNNFRDFGGQRTTEGRQVARGLLFRSGQAGSVGAIAFSDIEALELANVIDLRFRDEAVHSGMPWRDGSEPRLLALEESRQGDAPHHAFFREELADADRVHALYRRFYGDLPLDPRYADLFGRALRQLAEGGGASLVHCSAGKDRTGLFCALMLGVLEVPRADIDADYLLSNAAASRDALRPEIARRFAEHGRAAPPDAIMAAIVGVSPDYLDASFSAINRSFGSREAYFDAIGVGGSVRAALKARYLKR